MKKNVVKLVAIAFAVALLSTFLFYRLLIGKLASEDGQERPVVVAARKLETGTALTKADLKLAPLAGAAGAKGIFASREQALGQIVVEPIEANAPVSETSIAPRESKAAAGVRIPAGMRAISIHVQDSTGVVAMIRPGNRVDIHAVADPNSGAARLRTVLQNIEVLANNAQTDGGPGRQGAQVVTVLVKPDQAEVLALADSAARVRLALRNPADNAQAAARRLAVNQLFDGELPQPAPARRSAKADFAAARRPASAAPACPVAKPAGQADVSQR